MATKLEKIKLTTGVSDHNHFDLSTAHFTTMKFFEPRVSYIHEMVPGEKVSVDMRQFTRLNPLIKPLMGDVKINNRAFWVRMPNIMSKWNEFIADTPTFDDSGDAIIPSVPTISNSVFLKVFADYLTDRGTQSDYDYYDCVSYPSQAAANHYRKFTGAGRTVYHILTSLGYNIQLAPKSDPDETLHEVTYSALPLLALAKVMRDWYSNQAWSDWNDVDVFFENRYSFNVQLVATEVWDIIRNSMFTTFEKDYFTSANLKPINTNELQMDTALTINDVTQGHSSVYNKSVVVSGQSTDGTPYVKTASGSSTTVQAFSQYIDTALHKVTDWVKRHQLAGAQSFNRILAEYGEALEPLKLDRTSYLGNMVTEVNISEVVANNATDQKTLGELGGKGLGGASKTFHYSTDEFGYLIIISTIVPRFSYMNGVNPVVDRKDRLEFFTPTFDGLGVEPIPFKYLKNDYTRQGHDTDAAPSSIFGFTSRYATYKMNVSDTVSGDFHINSRNTNMDGWIIKREIKDIGNVDSYHTINKDFQTAGPHKLNNIFNFDQSEYDPFVISMYFKVDAMLPMKKMFDDYEWSDEHAKNVNIEKDGVSLN